MNAIRCRHCGETIESKHRHDFVTHTCEKMRETSGKEAFIAVDGGKDYGRRLGSRDNWEEASE